MTESAEKPVAVRAVAFRGTSKRRRRPERRVRYDALWADGRVDFDVSLSEMMDGRDRADFTSVQDAVHEHCPELGAGQWVDDVARVVDGPQPPEPTPPAEGWGQPHRYRPATKAPSRQARIARRLGASVLGLLVGLFAVRVSDAQGFFGIAGASVMLLSLAPSLSLLLPARRRT